MTNDFNSQEPTHVSDLESHKQAIMRKDLQQQPSDAQKDVLPQPTGTGITRLVYKEIVRGDRRKFEAQSNDTPSGGGARDLRYSPYEEFVKVFGRMLPTRDANDVCTGHFTWIDKGAQKRGDAFFHPPTSVRPNEGRIASVDKYLPLDTLPSESEGTTILIIYQDKHGEVWPYFTTDRSLASGEWHPAVSELILKCLHAHRRTGVSCCGYIDYEFNEVFCNGK